MKLTTLGKFALGSSVGIIASMAAPMAAFAAPAGVNVPCTGQAALVGAINAANAAGGGTINLARGCHYALLSADSADNPLNGLPVVMTRITVNGNDATIDGTNSVRVLEVDGPGGNLSLQDVTVTGGSADIGGGIENFGGTVSLNHSQVTGNTAAQAGGGIASATFDPASVAKLTLNNSAVTDNSQTVGPQDNGLGGGGIVSVLGTVTVNSSQVNGNTAMGFVGGGIANGDYMGFSGTTSFLTVNNSQVRMTKTNRAVRTTSARKAPPAPMRMSDAAPQPFVPSPVRDVLYRGEVLNIPQSNSAPRMPPTNWATQ
jgi:hypothetical protein